MSAVTMVRERSALARFTVADASSQGEKTSFSFMAASMMLVLFFGIMMMTVEVPVPFSGPIVQSKPVTIHLQPHAAPVIAEPEPIVQAEIEKAPVLEPETILAAPVDRPQEKPEKLSTVVPEKPVEETAPPVVRRVYGVRKIYGKGLGNSTSEPSGLVSKIGNTVDGVADNLVATEEDLKGELASLSSVDKAPEPVRRIKPVYSQAMLKAKIRGVVTAYLLVDVDGTVRDVKVTEDIGLDSRQVATKALSGFKFKPALKNNSPVAVWILHRIRFEFQE